MLAEPCDTSPCRATGTTSLYPSPSSIPHACSPTAVDNDLLPSPPRFPIMDTYDPDFYHKFHLAYHSSNFRDRLRCEKYGRVAYKYRRGMTPSPSRRLWAARLEQAQWEEEHAISMSDSSDDECVIPASIKTKYARSQTASSVDITDLRQTGG